MTSFSTNPASIRRLAMASAAVVTLPTESVVLISTSCLKMWCANSLTAGGVAARSGVGDWADMSVAPIESIVAHTRTVILPLLFKKLVMGMIFYSFAVVRQLSLRLVL